MLPTDNNKPTPHSIQPAKSADHSSADNDADKTGTDTNADKTKLTPVAPQENKFDKPAREPNPDTTGIDINSDKTKIEPNKK